MKARLLLVLVLLVAVVVSGLGVAYVQHVRRGLLAELQVQDRVRDEMQVEWGQLRLEQGLWIQQERIEKVARERLGLERPPARDIVVVTR